MKHVFQSINLHGNIITDGGSTWPTENKHIANKEYVDRKFAEATGTDFFKEGEVTGQFFIRNTNPYKLGPIERNNGWEAIVLTTTVFNNRPNDTTPTVSMQIGGTTINFTNVDATASDYGFTLGTNQHLYRYLCNSAIGTGYIGNDSVVTIEQLFSYVEIGEDSYDEATVTTTDTLNGLTFKFVPVISTWFDKELEELDDEFEYPYITELGIASTTAPNINVKSLTTLDNGTPIPQNYYIVIPENDYLPNNNSLIGFYYWFKDNETNECVSEKTFLDISDAQRVTWLDVDCDVLFFNFGYIDVPNNQLSLVVDSIFY